MFNPTEEQLNIIEAAQDTEDNILITALAGAAKTSTLVLIAEALPDTSILCLAFNAKIAQEMRERLPENCEAKTLNSLGHRSWMETIGTYRLTLDNSKMYTIFRSIIDSCQDPELVKEVYEDFSDHLKTLRFAKACGYIPEGFRPPRPFSKGKRLMDEMEFESRLDERLNPRILDMMNQALIRSCEMAFKGVIDFDDQILMPTLFGGHFPRFPLVMVDEAQDLSALNHLMLSKIARKRLIAVGDQCQAIYGFRGAHEESMDLLKKSFSMVEYKLTISFRCGWEIVEEAKWRAPLMQAWRDPGSGEVISKGEWTVDDIPEDAAIICRNNAPLFECAINLLRNGRYPQLVGMDIGKGLIKIMEKLGPNTMGQEEAERKLDQWYSRKLEKARDDTKVKDQAACIRLFIRRAPTLGSAVNYARTLMRQSGPIQLMTGHKSKGLEFDNVFILDQHLLRDKGQDRNLLYVMQTRAKQTLTYIASENFVDGAAD